MSVLSVEVGPVVVDVVEAELEFEVDLVVDVVSSHLTCPLR